MKLRNLILCFVLFAIAAMAQSKPAAAPAKAKTSSAVPSTTAGAPSADEVNEFLRRMFGYDPSLTWTVQAIIPTEAPGVTHIVATIGQPPRPIHLYAVPGGKFAIAGDMIPFGADPFAATRATLAEQAKGVSRGPANAIVTVVEFSDLQCPFCRGAQPIIDRLVAETGARLVFQPFPLPIHPWALKAAAYAECAAQQKHDSFWGFINGVYEDQSNINDANLDAKLAGIATAAGGNAKQIATCAATSAVNSRIQQSIELGKSVGVGSTPTIFINGRKVTGLADLPFEHLKALVEFEAAESSKQKK
jgi:protein-disulfide isomerase